MLNMLQRYENAVGSHSVPGRVWCIIILGEESLKSACSKAVITSNRLGICFLLQNGCSGIAARQGMVLLLKSGISCRLGQELHEVEALR